MFETEQIQFFPNWCYLFIFVFLYSRCHHGLCGCAPSVGFSLAGFCSRCWSVSSTVQFIFSHWGVLSFSIHARMNQNGHSECRLFLTTFLMSYFLLPQCGYNNTLSEGFLSIFYHVEGKVIQSIVSKRYWLN